jgi:Calx-beta domain/Glycosyl hydrolase family 99/Calcineurin-like phosphoesterase
VLAGFFAGNASAATQTFTPVADAYVREDAPSSNFGSGTTLHVDSSPTRRSYLRFDLSSLPAGSTITGGTLRLYVSYDCSASSPGWEVSTLADNSWQESAITYANAPTSLSGPLANPGGWTACGWTQAQLPPGSLPTIGLNTDGLNSYVVTTPSSSHKEVHSRENANSPELVVTYTPPSSPPPPSSPSLSIDDVRVTEGNSGSTNAVFSVSLSAPSPNAVTVSYATANGTATSPVDYTASSGSLTFAPGELSKTIAVPVVGDAVVEPDETFSLSLSNASNATIGDFQGTGTIENDDATDYQPSFPIRASFYYQWFPEGWTQHSIFPYTRYSPSLGFYDSGSPATIQAHVRSMLYGRFQATIASWWGQNQKSEQTRVPALLTNAAAVDPKFRVTLYYEREGSGNPTESEIRGDLEYIRSKYGGDPSFLRVNGRPVLFVYNADDTTCSVVDRWKAANNTTNFYLVLKVFSGWDSCASQPDGWHQYGPATAYQRHIPADPGIAGSVNISPGFWHVEDADPPGGDRPYLARDITRWKQNIRDMIASGAKWHLVTSFNEWGEGTSVESADEWSSPSGQGLYLDALRDADAPVPPTPDPVLVGAGDIATAPEGASGADEATARLLDSVVAANGKVTVFTAGDNAYEAGAPSEFLSFYEPTWGRHKAITKPSPGNHDYATAGAAGYFDYFGAAAGDGTTGYYAYELGDWRIYSLNSEIAHGARSPQVQWLRGDLATHPGVKCVLAYWHRPRFSSGTHGSDKSMKALWQALYDHKADVVVAGHDHNYQRFAPQTPTGAADPADGIRQFVVGTGGRSHYVFANPIANTEAYNTDTYGVLKLTLHPTSYDFEFVPEAGRTYNDTGTAAPCH